MVYSLGGGWLHHLIISYKRDADPSVPHAVRALARLYERFLGGHEACVAGASHVPHFQLVTTVPSGDSLRDLYHPLRRIVGALVPHTRERYERLLMRSSTPAIPRVFDPARYTPTRRLQGEAVLLIDDLWASGASAESAAAALLAAGAGTVSAIVIGRHVNRGWGNNDGMLARLSGEGDARFERCLVCAGDAPTPISPPPHAAAAG